MPRVRFHLFEVAQEDGDLNFGDALAQIAVKPIEERSTLLGDRRAILLESSSGTRSSAYLFTRVRMEGLPPKTGLDGHREDLDLDDDEGLGEDIAIAYDKVLNVVAIQRNRFSLSASNIIQYILSYFDELQIAINPIMSQDALERYSRQTILRKARIKLASTTDLSFLKGKDISEAERIMIQQMLESPYVDLIFSVGHRRGGLPQWIDRLVGKFIKAFQSGEDSIINIQITGKEDDDSESEYIDLLKERLTYDDDVEMSGRTINTAQLMSCAKNAIKANRKLLADRNV